MLSIQQLADAIPRRRSVRKYSALQVPATILSQLRDTDGLKSLGLTTCRAELIHAPGELDAVFTGVIGSYGKIKGASGVIVLLIPEDSAKEGMLEAGYLGEQLVLRATALGLSTCWVGGMFRFKTLMGRLSIGPNERVAALIAVGYAAQAAPVASPLWHRFMKRKSLQQIASPTLLQSAPWVQAGVEAVRLAPSAVNLQPWFLSGDSREITLKPVHSRSFTYMDLGIAMLHFQVAAESAGQLGKWKVTTSIVFESEEE